MLHLTLNQIWYLVFGPQNYLPRFVDTKPATGLSTEPTFP